MKVRIFTCIAVLLLAGSVFFSLAACAQRGTDGSGGVQHGQPDNEQAQSPGEPSGSDGENQDYVEVSSMYMYIGKGDVLVHAPEQKNLYQFFINNELDGRVFAMAEGNYDLLANVDFSYSDKVFAAWEMYMNLRGKAAECTYGDHTDMFNNYGGIAVERPYDEGSEAARDINYTQDWGFDLTLLKQWNIATLAGVYDKVAERGAAVYFSWAPINEQSDGNYNIYVPMNNVKLE